MSILDRIMEDKRAEVDARRRAKFSRALSELRGAARYGAEVAEQEQATGEAEKAYAEAQLARKASHFTQQLSPATFPTQAAPLGAGPDDHLVEARVRPQQISCLRLDEPRDARVGVAVAQRRDQPRRHDHVAERAQANDEDRLHRGQRRQEMGR